MIDRQNTVSAALEHHEMTEHLVPPPSGSRDTGTELAARRTGMSFQRTRLSADRTLMSVIRTALSLIGFGFTIFQFFHKLNPTAAQSGAHPARNFGATLALLGILMLTVGIVYHSQFMLALRKTRAEMTASGLIHGKSSFPPSLTLSTAVLLLAIGLAAAASIVFDFGPFS
jgi:putative membrane protein